MYFDPLFFTMQSWCLVLHMCSRSFTRDAYARSLQFWNASDDTFVVDSCANDSAWSEFSGVRRLPFVQAAPPRRRFYLSMLERDQMHAALAQLPRSCAFVVKLTGKYASRHIIPTLRNFTSSTRLAVQSWVTAYGGWHSELFGMERALLSHALANWKDGRNTEAFVLQWKRTLELVAPQRLMYFPRMPLEWVAVRNGDGMRVSAL